MPPSRKIMHPYTSHIINLIDLIHLLLHVMFQSSAMEKVLTMHLPHFSRLGLKCKEHQVSIVMVSQSMVKKITNGHNSRSLQLLQFKFIFKKFAHMGKVALATKKNLVFSSYINKQDLPSWAKCISQHPNVRGGKMTMFC